MPQRRSALSTEFTVIPVEVVIPQLASADVEADQVQFNFANGGLPPHLTPGDSPNLPQWSGWLDGQWVDLSTGGLVAVILTGPGEGAAVDLARGKWAIWLKVIDNPSVPVAPVDTLTIF